MYKPEGNSITIYKNIFNNIFIRKLLQMINISNTNINNNYLNVISSLFENKSRSDILSSITDLKRDIINLRRQHQYRDIINFIANSIANYIAQISRVSDVPPKNPDLSSFTEQKMSHISTLRYDESNISSTQLSIGHFHRYLPYAVDITRYFVGPELYRPFNNKDIPIHIGIQLTFNLVFNKLIILASSRTNLLFPVRLYLSTVDDYKLENMIKYKIPDYSLDVNEFYNRIMGFLGIMFIEQTHEPLYFYNINERIRGRQQN